MGVVAEGEQRRDVAVGHEPDVTALAPVAAVGTAHHDGSLPAEADAAGAAVTSTDIELGFVDKGGHGDLPGYRPQRSRTPSIG